MSFIVIESFQGMFTSDLQEKFTKRRTFVFYPEEEDCSAEEFTRFLHHLSGCRAQCSLIQSAEACVAMVKVRFSQISYQRFRKVFA